MEDRSRVLPQEYIESEEVREAVMDVVKTLPQKQREAVMLHYYNGLSVTDTAVAMDINKSNVTRYLEQARNKIKRELEKKSKQNV
jgi:RNA polymerase sigma-70 factor (ECF subfamily)